MEWSTKDVHLLIPTTCEYVTLRGKKGFADVIKLRALRRGDVSSLSSGSNHHSGPCKREAGGQGQSK